MHVTTPCRTPCRTVDRGQLAPGTGEHQGGGHVAGPVHSQQYAGRRHHRGHTDFHEPGLRMHVGCAEQVGYRLAAEGRPGRVTRGVTGAARLIPPPAGRRPVPADGLGQASADDDASEVGCDDAHEGSRRRMMQGRPPGCTSDGGDDDWRRGETSELASWRRPAFRPVGHDDCEQALVGPVESAMPGRHRGEDHGGEGSGRPSSSMTSPPAQRAVALCSGWLRRGHSGRSSWTSIVTGCGATQVADSAA
jgi:hypothetical protein